MTGRIISLILALAYVTFAFIAGDIRTGFGTAAFLLIPLSCIWLGNRMGPLSAQPHGRYSWNAQPNPGWIVIGSGWIILLIPLAIWLWGYI